MIRFIKQLTRCIQKISFGCVYERLDQDILIEEIRLQAQILLNLGECDDHVTTALVRSA